MLAKNHRVRIMSLLPLLIIACLSFVIGIRFLIFFAPINALGLSYIGQLCGQRFFHSTTPTIIASSVGIALLGVPVFQKATTEATRPVTVYVNPAIQAVSPLPEGLVWTSWTLGYPLLFNSAHRIIGDGQTFSGERMVYNYLPLATSNQRFAVNFMHFYAKHGFNGIRAFYRACRRYQRRLFLVVRNAAQHPGRGSTKSSPGTTVVQPVSRCRRCPRLPVSLFVFSDLSRPSPRHAQLDGLVRIRVMVTR